MQEVVAYSTLAMTLGLVVARPRLYAAVRLNPAMATAAGVLVMALVGALGLSDVLATAVALWRSFVAIAAIMVMTEVAMQLGVLDRWASHVEARARSTAHLFGLVFGLGVVTAATLNNDAAILLLTPLVVRLAKRRLPDQPALVVPFAFAVFMAAGVAPLVVSNPMNMVVAEFSGIGFNRYAARMIPIAAAGWVIAFAVLRWHYRGALASRFERAPRAARGARSTAAQRCVMALLLVVLVAYSAVGYAGGPVWAVAVGGAALAVALLVRARGAHPLHVVRTGISWHTLAFLLGVVTLATGLLNVGLVARLSGYYGAAGVAEIGVISALGSAVLNNHPMAYLNMLALDAAGRGMTDVLAALIGGDLGPRLLPMGSLAGLLWLDALRRQGVTVRLREFVTVGALVTVPTLAASLALLWLESLLW